METTKMKVLWMITERGDRSFWTRIGIGNVNRDGSVNLVIDAMPIRGATIQLRDYTPRDAENELGNAASTRTANDTGRAHHPLDRQESRP